MALCFNPFFVDAPSYSRYEKQPVPCGKCPACLKRRASAWAFRLLQEMKRDHRAYFLTLTYETPPLSSKGYMTLVKKDWQLFMKRLRKFHGKNSIIRYYAVGEYGSKRFRPHFHSIIYGINPSYVEPSWSPNNGTKFSGVPGLFELDPDVNPLNIAYVCKYLTKGRRIPAHKNDDRIPEFSLMSKNLGLCYLTDQMVKYHRADLSRTYHTLEGGIKISMPRYYKERIYSKEEREFIAETNQPKFSERWEQLKTEWQRHNPTQNFEFAFTESIKQEQLLFFNKNFTSRLDL